MSGVDPEEQKKDEKLQVRCAQCGAFGACADGWVQVHIRHLGGRTLGSMFSVHALCSPGCQADWYEALAKKVRSAPGFFTKDSETVPKETKAEALPEEEEPKGHVVRPIRGLP